MDSETEPYMQAIKQHSELLENLTSLKEENRQLKMEVLRLSKQVDIAGDNLDMVRISSLDDH